MPNRRKFIKTTALTAAGIAIVGPEAMEMHPRPVDVEIKRPIGIAWSPDGTFLLFDTGQRTEVTQLARVDLTFRTKA